MKRSKRNPQVRLPGLPPITVVSEAEAETADMVVCMRNGAGEYFSDDIRTTCAVCGGGIHHRPHAPKTPPKVCMECAVALAEKGPEAAN